MSSTYTVYFEGIAATPEIEQLRREQREAERKYRILQDLAGCALSEKMRCERRVARAEWEAMPADTRPAQYWRAFGEVATAYPFGWE